jgi:hypothetical protein
MIAAVAEIGSKEYRWHINHLGKTEFDYRTGFKIMTIKICNDTIAVEKQFKISIPDALRSAFFYFALPVLRQLNNIASGRYPVDGIGEHQIAAQILAVKEVSGKINA